MSTQQQKIKEFRAVSQASEKVAIKKLKQHNWNLERAVDDFFAGGTCSAASTANSASASAINAIFDKYKEREEDAILVDGIVRYCEDLQVDPTDVRILILAHCLNAERMCEFSRSSFVQGWIQLGGDTIQKQREIVRDLDKELDDPEALRDVYQFAFNFGRAENQKSLPLDVAMVYWQLLLKGRFKHLDLWLQFVQDEYGKSISRDTWNLLLDFSQSINEACTNHDAEGAWPVLIDEFVTWAQKRIPN